MRSRTPIFCSKLTMTPTSIGCLCALGALSPQLRDMQAAPSPVLQFDLLDGHESRVEGCSGPQAKAHRRAFCSAVTESFSDVDTMMFTIGMAGLLSLKSEKRKAPGRPDAFPAITSGRLPGRRRRAGSRPLRTMPSPGTEPLPRCREFRPCGRQAPCRPTFRGSPAGLSGS